MAGRGAYSKGVRKREEILTTALDFVAQHGYSSTTIRELAQAVELSPTGLLHYFGSKEALFVEILKRRDAIDVESRGGAETGEAANERDPGREFAEVIRHNADVPGLVQLYVGLSAEAVPVTHPAHEYFHERYAAVRSEVAKGIRAGQARGDVRSDADADMLATILVAVADGLQSQWVYDEGIDMGEHMAHLLELLTPPTAPTTRRRTAAPHH